VWLKVSGYVPQTVQSEAYLCNNDVSVDQDTLARVAEGERNRGGWRGSATNGTRKAE